MNLLKKTKNSCCFGGNCTQEAMEKAENTKSDNGIII